MVSKSLVSLQRHLPQLSFSRVLAISAVLRVALILYSEWHDAHSTVKYTDVDYRVFSDAAHFVLNPTSANRAQGYLGLWTGFGDCEVRIPEQHIAIRRYLRSS